MTQPQQHQPPSDAALQATEEQIQAFLNLLEDEKLRADNAQRELNKFLLRYPNADPVMIAVYFFNIGFESGALAEFYNLQRALEDIEDEQ